MSTGDQKKKPNHKTSPFYLLYHEINISNSAETQSQAGQGDNSFPPPPKSEESSPSFHHHHHDHDRVFEDDDDWALRARERES